MAVHCEIFSYFQVHLARITSKSYRFSAVVQLVTEVNYESDNITPWDLRNKGPSANVPIVMKVMDSASTYSSIWETGNLDKTDDIMVENMTEVRHSPSDIITSVGFQRGGGAGGGGGGCVGGEGFV